MQLKDVTQIIKAIIEERDKIPRIIDKERYIPNPQPYHDGNFMRGGIRKALRIIEQAPVVDAVEVVRCRECKNGAPLPEEARDEFSPGVMRCLAGRGDCDKYCTTWEDGFCDEGAKLDAKDMDVPTKDGGAGNG